VRIVIAGTGYDFVEALTGAALGDLLKLKVKTKTADYLGTTVKSMTKAFKDLGEKTKADDFDSLDLLGDEDFLRAMIGVIWLSRRKAGERLEVEDAAAISFTEFSIETDDDDEDGDDEDGDAPKASADGGAVDDQPAHP